MKALKLTVMIIVVIVILLLIIPIFLSNTVTVSQTQCIKTSPQTVFNQVNEIKNWEHWSPFTNDSTMIITYFGPDMGVGAGYRWKGEKMGKGSLTIEKSEPYKLIKNKLDFGPQGKVIGTWNFNQQGDSICVTWSIKLLDLKYPFGRWLGLMMKSGMKPMLKKSLQKMKTYTEGMKPSKIIREKD